MALDLSECIFTVPESGGMGLIQPYDSRISAYKNMDFHNFPSDHREGGANTKLVPVTSRAFGIVLAEAVDRQVRGTGETPLSTDS